MNRAVIEAETRAIGGGDLAVRLNIERVRQMEANEAETLAAVEQLVGQSYVGVPCTLDGHPATITGRLERFGTVAMLPHGARYEYAWATIARVMQHNGGRFKS